MPLDLQVGASPTARRSDAPQGSAPTTHGPLPTLFRWGQGDALLLAKAGRPQGWLTAAHLGSITNESVVPALPLPSLFQTRQAVLEEICSAPQAAGAQLVTAVQAGGEEAQAWVYTLLVAAADCPDEQAAADAYQVGGGGGPSSSDGGRGNACERVSCLCWLQHDPCAPISSSQVAIDAVNSGAPADLPTVAE